MLIISALSYFMLRVAPGGPFDQERRVPPAIEKNLNEKFHFDWPLWKQYLQYMGPLNLDKHGAGFVGGDGSKIYGGLFTGDMLMSFRYANRSVNEMLTDAFPVSLELAAWAMLFALILGGVAGTLAASNPGTWKDHVPMGIAMTGICTPNFLLGPLLVLIFAMHLSWVNIAGWDEPVDRILPAITLGAAYAAYIARLMRGGLMDVLRQDFIRTARAKGLSKTTILFRHALRGGILPTVSFLGPALAGIVTGSIVIEKIFDIPGMGRLFVDSALNRDYTLVMGTLLLYATLIISMNIIVDIIYAFLDPRVRYE